MLTIALIILVLWLLGVIGSIGGGFIHLLLIIGLVLLIVDLLDRRRHTI